MEIKGVLAEALNGLQRARGIAPRNALERSALRWELYATLQNALEAMAMIVADLGLRKPVSYAELGRVLCEAGLLEERYADVASSAASARNTLAHAYRRLENADLSAIVGGVLADVEALIGRLLELLDRKGIDPPGEGLETAAKVAPIFAKHGVTLAYLFGSRARGTARANSDYDIAVLFQSEDTTVLNEIQLAKGLAVALGVPADTVEVVALNRAGAELVARALKEGIPLYATSEGERRRWERNTYLDLLRRKDLNAVYVTRIMGRVRRRA